ncbi:MAG: sigma-54 interaction domain-containing protein [Terriglobales bacterium]
MKVTTMPPLSLASSAAPTPAMPTTPALLGECPAIVAIRRTMAQVADTNLTVLLQGESGSGKEVVARQIAAQSARGEGFIKVNCAAIPQELWESELFGYEPGAFTGANRQKYGKFELAGNGTIFLDEISEMPLPQQAKLLQVLQDGEFSRLGSLRTQNVEVRVIAASNVDLHQAVAGGQFRADLFYRLNVIAIQLPPLRQRRGDLPLLANHFLATYRRALKREAAPFSANLWRRFEIYDWPGNIRELENLVKRYVVLGSEEAVLSELLRAGGAPQPAVAPEGPAASAEARAGRSEARGLLAISREAAWQAEREAILEALALMHWNRRLAARHLNVSYKSLQNKLKVLLAETPARPAA